MDLPADQNGQVCDLPGNPGHVLIRTKGLIPEIVGRLPVVTYLDPLNPKALKRILTEPKNALVKQFTKLFKMDGVKLSFTDGALDFVVEKSVDFKLGARGLRSIIEAILNDAMFEFPSDTTNKELKVTRAYASEKLQKNNLAKLRVA